MSSAKKARRRSVYLAEFGHKQPIPAAARIGNLLVSGIVYGLDPATGKPAETLDGQCTLMFRHLRRILEAEGGTIDDILKINVWMNDRSQRDALNREWLAMFPDPEARPVRQTMTMELDGGKLVQCDFMAVLDGSASS